MQVWPMTCYILVIKLRLEASVRVGFVFIAFISILVTYSFNINSCNSDSTASVQL